MRALISTVLEGVDLTESQVSDAVESVFAGVVSEPQVAAFLTALRMKGETEEEVAGAVKALRKRMISLFVPTDLPLVDICGTGGDRCGTFNISTTVAFVLAATGLRVAKHGNRAVSSGCGSADVLEELGVPVNIAPERVCRCITTIGVGFLYAPLMHPAMGRVASVRRDLGFPTLFNIAGPLANPALTRRQVVGVFHRRLLRPVARALGRLGADRAVAVHGEDGLDEVSVSGPTYVVEWRDGLIEEYTVKPEDVGLERSPLSSIRGGDAKHNARLIEGILSGQPGPQRDVVLFNAALALRIAGACSDLPDGMRAAAEAIDTGRAYQKLCQLKEALR